MAATDYNATLTNMGGSVDIMIGRIDYDFDRMLTDIQIPKQTTPLTWLLDLKRLKELITVTGWLQDENGSSGLIKKQVIEAMVKSDTTTTITWGTGGNAQTYIGSIKKGQVREVPGRIVDSSTTLGSETKTFNVMIQFQVGTLK